MKKNIMMRLASFLLVAVLISTSAISGTYAKYVTKAEGGDSARVAKWGVTIAVDGNELFANQYTDTTNGLTVESLDAHKVVAPGTSSDESDVMRFKITGQPEVDVNLAFAFENVSDIYLKGGVTYTDYTEATGYDDAGNAIYGKTFTLTEDYYPVVFKLWNDKTGAAPLATGKLSDIAAYLEGASVSKNYDAKTNLATILGGVNGQYTLTWEWAFEQTDKDLYDKADTLLGNLMVDPSLTAAENYNLYVGYDLTITATQVN